MAPDRIQFDSDPLRVVNYSTMTAIYKTIRLTGADGLSLAADVTGPADGYPVLLLHGGGQTRHSWHHTAGVLGERGFHTYNIDLRGHGESDWSPIGNYGLDSFSADIRAVSVTISAQDGLRRTPALVGASLGGISSLAAIAETNDPVASALVLVDVGPKIERTGADRIGAFMMEHMDDGFATLDEVADSIAAYNPHRPRPTNLEGLKKNLRERDGRWYWHWDPAFITGRRGSSDETRMLTDPLRLDEATHEFAKRNIPTLMVRGRQSDLLSEAGAKAYVEMVPHAQFIDVAGAGHMVAGDRNDVFNDAVVGFLNSLTV